MTTAHEPGGDDAKYLEYGQRLADAIAADIGPWLQTELAKTLDDPDDELQALLRSVESETKRAITELVTADVDIPLSGPLERIRRSIEPLTEALGERQVPAPLRNPLDVEMRPDDRYGFGPMTFLDISPEVHEAGIAWGAAKAHLHMQRRRQP